EKSTPNCCLDGKLWSNGNSIVDSDEGCTKQENYSVIVF
ncbi:unnamed protein product, partial [Heterotrigona itama]